MIRLICVLIPVFLPHIGGICRPADVGDLTFPISIYPTPDILRSSRGSIESPGYPGNHPTTQQCAWEIQANVPSTIRVSFLAFNTALDSRFWFVKDLGSPFGGQFTQITEGSNTPRNFSVDGETNLVIVWEAFATTSPGWQLQYSITPKAQEVTTVQIASSTETTLALAIAFISAILYRFFL